MLNRFVSSALSTVSLQINDNTISADASGFCTNGIYVTDVSGTNTPTTSLIRDNVITETANGIVVSVVKQALNIETNSITTRYATTGNINGIKAIGCVGVTISTNHTKYNNVGGTAYTSTGNITACGIYLQNSTNMLVKCNLIEDAARSLVFEGACSSPIPSGYGIRQNTMRRAQDGFVLLNSGVIGQQGRLIPVQVPSNNFWDLTTTPTFDRSQTYTDNTTGANTASKLYMNNTTTGASATMPTSNQTSGTFPGDNYLSGTGLNTLTGTTLTCATPPAFGGGGQTTFKGPSDPEIITDSLESAALEALVLDESVFPVYSDESHWMRKKYVYDELRRVPTLNNTPVLDDFFDDIAGNYSEFSQVEDHITSGAHASANTLNESILPSNVPEANQQEFNRQMLKSLLGAEYTYTIADKESLDEIAQQCPLEGGQAVYQARNILMMIAGKVIDFTEDCSGESRIIKPFHFGKLSDDLVKLYPNPTDGNIILEYSILPEKKVSF